MVLMLTDRMQGLFWLHQDRVLVQKPRNFQYLYVLKVSQSLIRSNLPLHAKPPAVIMSTGGVMTSSSSS